MVEIILLFIGFLFVFGYLYSLKAKNHDLVFYVCNKCKTTLGKTELVNRKCPMCAGEVSHLEKYRTEIHDFEHDYDKPMIKHKIGCGCRLCYKNPTDFRDLKEYNWWDFHDGSGERVYANGTLPLFGLWTNKENLRAPHCLQAKFDWRFNSPCRDPHQVIDGIDKSPNFPFPAECDDNGRCRIRGPLEDHIKNL